MEIATWNVNGLRSAERKGFVGWVVQSGLDLYCLQEIRGNREQFSQKVKNIPGYHIYFNSAKKKGYSGVGVYTKTKPNKVSSELGHKKFDDEGRFLRLDYNDFSILNIYIPNGGRQKEWFDYKFEVYDTLFDYLRSHKNTPFILTGDFNIAHKEEDLAHPDKNKNNTMFTPEERKLIDHLLSLGFIDTFRQFTQEKGHYTWWTNFAKARERNLGWRIDYVFVAQELEEKLKDAYILSDVTGSDHCPAGISINLNT